MAPKKPDFRRPNHNHDCADDHKTDHDIRRHYPLSQWDAFHWCPGAFFGNDSDRFEGAGYKPAPGAFARWPTALRASRFTTYLL